MGASPGGALGVGVGVGVGGAAGAGYVPVSVVEAGTRGVVLGWRAPPPAGAAPPGGPPQPHHHVQAPPQAPPPHPHPHSHHHALQLAEAEWPPRTSLIAVDSAAILPVQLNLYTHSFHKNDIVL